ncbi:Dot/Icm type IV secretion system ATPase DotB [Aquicella lusitana]|uniref:Defect-in-organelle-trafficking protein DotB n=1 Tax=Aquicella lusitana TaxID=254246 RepID=A0A370GD19_9COXI|nr:Dot/Icm type IV secretion system ATPase DotB [Aquicella lusitana]RDI41688.1 defect-in-organelle-trafficking protein DotB [Aquicella lusitana]VVC72664.1 Twitching mobility protein [Aquicella lusitana]
MTEFLFPQEPIRLSIEAANEILIHCVKLGASDITFQTGEPIIAEVYGKLKKVTRRRLSNTEVGEVINAMYGPNATTIIMSGKDIDTHYEIRPSRTERYRFRINGTGCMVEGHDGIQITARTIPTDPPTLESMNLSQTVLDAIAPEQGVVYVTGATGSGKSTLLAAIIRDITENAESNRKVLTYEAPIEFVFDNVEKVSSVVSQSEIPRHLPSFAAGVRNALRRKPRLILVGEARDPETISAVMEAAMTGHPVYTTLHSNGVAETIRRLVITFPPDERQGRTIDIIETVRLVISQRLVPTVEGKRVALREYLVFDEKIRDILLETDILNITNVVRKLVREYGRTMEADAHEKLNAGIISERQYRLVAEQAKREEKDTGAI